MAPLPVPAKDEGLRDARDQRMRLLGDLSPGHAENAKSACLQIRVPGAVTLERRASRVKSVAVDLDDQTTVAPQQVDLMPADSDIDLGARKARGGDQTQEAFFGL
jgi:hypothetical protein